MAIKVLPVSGEQTELLDAVIALGDRYTKYLGLLTPPAYRKHAEDGGLLVAVDDEEVVGYALFGLPKRNLYVRLAHLCVAEEHRAKGVARRLIETIRERHAHRLGIRAKCRRDYGLSDMWTALGFVPNGESLGRGKDKETLDTWWLDLGHEDLFTEAQSDALLVVTVDHSVFAGLRGAGAERAVEESRALEAGWLADLIELAFTPQLLHEVRDIEDREERNHQRAGLAELRSLSPGPAAVSARLAELVAAAQKELPHVPLDSRQRARLRYVAETSCAGLQVLVTRDLGLAALADIAWAVARVKVVSPAVVTLHVDELRQAQVYRPADLMGTAFSAEEVAPGSEGELVAFFDQAGADSGSAFEERLRALFSDGVLWRRELLRDGEGRPVALYVWAMDGRTLNVAFLRTASHPLEETLARQLLFMLKRLGRGREAEVVRIADPYVSRAAISAAGADGFTEDEAGFAALLVDVCASAETVSEKAGEIATRLGRGTPRLEAGESPEIASVVERVWWPAKLINSALPTFIAPIKPLWSSELFDVPAMLVPRDDVLGISREHVYYRSSGHRGETVPARILWYVSEGTSGRQGKMVIGCSRLDEVLVDDPDTLFSRFEHLGVYGRAEVRATADASGKVMALRFSDTEIFPVQVTHSRLTTLAKGLGLRWVPPMSLSKTSNALFQAVYEEGHRKT
ncbi:GNAT family N-acetyltransferase [Streptomyces roseicoloratus]|uniref:GNAT family N-acetyltransferase n=1 Tax=Streptomyces roseicoloratus TaxID=2508722 RepID=A0ABY9RXW2_9ACTN|nr:GNAT family N-acetyltransferase [Streptomyces roseicoloratus]WMX47021.1 GNAT family N-acetyltransferase [Streptomyces roseicoloratus]